MLHVKNIYNIYIEHELIREYFTVESMLRMCKYTHNIS